MELADKAARSAAEGAEDAESVLRTGLSAAGDGAAVLAAVVWCWAVVPGLRGCAWWQQVLGAWLAVELAYYAFHRYRCARGAGPVYRGVPRGSAVGELRAWCVRGKRGPAL